MNDLYSCLAPASPIVSHNFMDGRRETLKAKELEVVAKSGNHLKACRGNFFAKSFPRLPLQKLPIVANTFSARHISGAAQDSTPSLSRIRPQPLSAQRQRLKIIGVFGKGSREGLFAKRPSLVTLEKTHRFCNRFQAQEPFDQAGPVGGSQCWQTVLEPLLS